MIYDDGLTKMATKTFNNNNHMKLPLNLDKCWDTYSVIEKLIEATDILLLEKDYDGHGWELMEKASFEGKELLSQIKNNKQMEKQYKPADKLVRGDTIIIEKDINYGPKRGIEKQHEKWTVLRVTKNTIQAQGRHRSSEYLPKFNEQNQLINYEIDL